jgi:hypothetical protein
MLIQVLLWALFGIAAVVCLWPVGMAFLAWPIVAMTLDVSPLFTTPPTTLDSDEAGRWTAAASAVFFPALIAAPLGAVAVERHARLGGFFTFALALIVAISSVSVLPIAIWTDLVRALQAGAITRPDERIRAARPS